MEKKEKKIPKYCFEIPLSGVDYIYQSNFSHSPVVVMKPLTPSVEPISSSPRPTAKGDLPVERIPKETRPTGKNEVVEPLQNGKREERKRISEILVKYNMPTRQVAINEIIQLLSQSKKECIFTKEELESISGSIHNDLMETCSTKCGTNYIEDREKLLKKIESLTNQKKDI